MVTPEKEAKLRDLVDFMKEIVKPELLSSGVMGAITMEVMRRVRVIDNEEKTNANPA